MLSRRNSENQHDDPTECEPGMELEDNIEEDGQSKVSGMLAIV